MQRQHRIILAISFLFATVLSVSSLLVSCEKVVVPNDDNGNENGNISFTIVNPVKDSVSITHLCVKILRKDGTTAFDNQQDSKNSKFKDINWSLPKGNYYLVAVAHGGSSNYGFATIHSEDSVSLPSTKIYYTMCGKKQIEVKAGIEPVKIELYHATALLRITSTTPLPLTDEEKRKTSLRVIVGDDSNPEEEIKQVSFSPMKYGLRTSPGNYYNILLSGEAMTKEDNDGNPQFDIYLMLRTKEETVKVRTEAIDKDGNTFKECDLGEVTLIKEKGEMGVLSGEIF